MTSDAAVSARLGLQQIGTFQLIPSSGVSASKRLLSRSKPMLLVEPRMILPSRISPGPRNQDEYEIAAARETHQEAADTSLTNGAARQKPGHVVVRHFRDWRSCCNAYKLGRPAASSLLRRGSERAGGSVMVRRRGRSRALGAGSARISANAKQV
jgi:hypothetical protein